ALLFGGFAGSETTRSQRNPSVNVTMLHNVTQGRVITIPQAAMNVTVDGFTITNTLNGTTVLGGGINCLGPNAVISHNVITNNKIVGTYGAGIICTGDHV